MKYCALLLSILAFGAACRNSNKLEVQKEPRLTKEIPNVYLKKSDSRLRFIRDTVYLDNSLFSGHLWEGKGAGDTSFCGSYFNGKEEGRHAKWYADGLMIEERFYVNGGKEGLHRGWWPDGRLKFRFHCYNNELDGPMEEWAQNGVRIKYFNFENGYEEGPQKLWWDNGKIRANYVIRKGKKYGFIGVELCANPYDSVNKK